MRSPGSPAAPKAAVIIPPAAPPPQPAPATPPAAASATGRVSRFSFLSSFGGKPKPAAVPKPPPPPRPSRQERAEARTLEARIARLEKTIAEQQKTQARLNNDLFAVHQRIAGTQTEAEKIQEKINTAGRQLSASEVEMASLRDQLAARKASAAAPATVSPVPSAATTTVAAATVADERRIHEQAIVLQQKEEEIRDLRAAVAARDELLKERSAVPGAKPAADTSLRPPSAAPAKPAVPPAPAVTGAAPAVATGRASRFSFLPRFGGKPKAAPAPKPAAPKPGTVTGEQAALVKLIDDGKTALREGRSADAELLFLQALEKNPALVSAQMGLASCRYAAGDLGEARRLASTVLGKDKRNAQALGLLGVIAWRTGDLKAAQDSLARAVRGDPKNAQWHSYLGIVLYQQNQAAKARQELERAVALNPDLAEAHFNLAVIFTQMTPPKADLARRHYEAALRLGSAPDERLDRILNPPTR